MSSKLCYQSCTYLGLSYDGRRGLRTIDQAVGGPEFAKNTVRTVVYLWLTNVSSFLLRRPERFGQSVKRPVPYVAPATRISAVLTLATPYNIVMNKMVDATITKIRVVGLLDALQMITGVKRSTMVIVAIRDRTAVLVDEVGKIWTCGSRETSETFC